VGPVHKNYNVELYLLQAEQVLQGGGA